MEYTRDNISAMVGQRIHGFRIKNKMSQETLAFASGLHPAYLGRVERGEKCPTVETLYKISNGLNIPLSELLDIDSEITPTEAEAVKRIVSAMSGLTGEEAVKLAEVVEKIISMKNSSA